MTLTEIANKAGTDKGTSAGSQHGFTDFYENNLSVLKERKDLRVLEIGVANGASLEMWDQFFEGKAKIYGIDITPFSSLPVFAKPNIEFIQADQSSEEQLLKAMEVAGNQLFDLIVDDGSHVIDHQFQSLKTLYRFVKPGGFYVLEDLHTSTEGWIGIGGKGYNESTLRFLVEGKVDTMDTEMYELANNIKTVTVFSRNPFGQHITSIIRFNKALV